MLKRSLIACLLCSSLFIASAFAGFEDVSSNSEHWTSIESLVEQGVLEGFDDGLFHPEDLVTRSQAAKIALLGAGIAIDESSVAGSLFSDVLETDWFYDDIGTAVGLGILSGFDDNTFRPDQPVLLSEMTKMVSLAMELNVETATASPYLDVPLDAWFADYAYTAKTWNLRAPQSDGLWYPEMEMTRGDFAEFVYRAQQVKTSGTAYIESTNWIRWGFPNVDVTLKIPYGWHIKQDGVGAAWLFDYDNGQPSLLSPFENGGTLLMTRYANNEGLSSSQVFTNLKENISGNWAESSVNGYSALTLTHQSGVHYKEWYVVMDNESIVHFVGMRGEGAYQETLESYLNLIIQSTEYESASTTGSDLSLDEIVELLREAIQVDGYGNAIMAYLSDWQLVETDTIGIGTGPVDYYYSPSINITVKYERSLDVILDIQDGKTSAF